MGEYFIEDISEIEPDSMLEGEFPDRTEDSNQLQNELMTRKMQENQDLFLLPTSW